MRNKQITPFKSKSARNFSLIEVMISFVLVLFCLIPLIYPNIAMYRQQQEFIDTIDIDYGITLLYGELIEQIYRGEIPFDDLIQNQPKEISISPQRLEQAGFHEKSPYRVTLTAQKEKMKGENGGRYIVVKVVLLFTVIKGNKENSKLEFRYIVPVVKLKENQPEENKEERSDETNPSKTGTKPNQGKPSSSRRRTE